MSMTKTVARLVIVVLALGLASTAWAVDPRLESGPTATVVEVVDGDTVVLDDGSQVRLVGIQAPLGCGNFVQSPESIFVFPIHSHLTKSAIAVPGDSLNCRSFAS